VTIISSIALDHQDWLGEDLESIAKEKAGILRSKVPLIYGDKQPLKAITEKAEILNAPLFLAEREVGWKRDEDLLTWHWEGMDKGEKVKLSHLPLPSLALSNVSLAMQALFLFEIKIDRGVLNSALSQLFLPGRFEKRRDKLTSVRVIFDVAHNPESAKLLGWNLIEEKNNHNNVCQISAVIAVMADKDVEGIVVALEGSIDKWYLTEVSDPRCMTAAELSEQVSLTSVSKICTSEQPIFESYNQACKEAETYGIRHPGKETAVLVTGSFHTVSALRDLSFQGD
jgi:dihydrofolate synthase/folylpolyglutamate synthase